MSIILLAFIAAVVTQAFGWLWHGPLFGMKWARATGMQMPQPGEKAKMPKGFAVMLLINFIANFIMGFATYLILANFGASNYAQAFITAAVLFVGFALPFQVISILWNGRPVKDQFRMFLISIGYQLINFAIWAFLFGWLAL